MPYITIKQPPVYFQLTFEEVMAGVEDLSKYVQPNITNTRTHWVERPNPRLLQNTKIDNMIQLLHNFNNRYEALF